MAVGLSEIIKGCADRAGLDEAFAESFRQSLLNDRALLEEFIYYIKNGAFLCKYKVADLSIADILVYQIDHFKAAMDQDRLAMKFNPDKMLLLAFDSMIRMTRDSDYAESLRKRLLSESGTDGTEMGTERIV